MSLNKMLRNLALLLFVVLLFVPDAGYACDCSLPRTGRSLRQQVIEARKKSAAVFTGTVLEIIKLPNDLHVSVKFKVGESWKGIRSAEAKVFTGQGGGDCGYKFETGKQYLVYAYKRTDSGLETNICQRTALLTESAEDLKVLGKGRLAEVKTVRKRLSMVTGRMGSESQSGFAITILCHSLADRNPQLPVCSEGKKNQQDHPIRLYYDRTTASAD
jgi:hypothetical protein